MTGTADRELKNTLIVTGLFANIRKIYKYSEEESLRKTDEEFQKMEETEADAWLLNLYNRVKDVTGEVTDCSHIKWGGKCLDGIVVRKNGKAIVTTIEAGGWNIQRYHLRVLVTACENEEVENTENEMEENEMTVKELRAKAKEMGIKGASRMTKEQLQEEINTINRVLTAKGKTVILKAFTGMVLGKYEVIAEEGTLITVETKKGELSFDIMTGLQVNANNPKFANKFEWA